MRKTGRTQRMIENLERYVDTHHPRTVFVLAHNHHYAADLARRTSEHLGVARSSSHLIVVGNTRVNFMSEQRYDSRPELRRGIGSFKVFRDNSCYEAAR